MLTQGSEILRQPVQSHFVQPVLLAMILPALSYKTRTLDEFQRNAGFASKRTTKFVLEYLLARGIGRLSRFGYSFSTADRIKIALLAIQSGNDIEKVSNFLSWQDFEAFVSALLNISGYETECNLHFSKPTRMQIDVLGFNPGSRLGIVIDCKHWKRNHLSAISLYARKQAQRTSDLLNHRRMISCAVPTVLTLHSADIRVVDGIPVVPISKFSSYIQEIPFYLDDEIETISLTNQPRMPIRYLSTFVRFDPLD
jgi:hypothetical protein